MKCTIDEAIAQAGLKTTSLYELESLLHQFERETELESVIAIALTERKTQLTEDERAVMVRMMTYLSDSVDMSVRWAVARNPYTSVSILEKLSCDDVNLVRALVATNPNTPEIILLRFFSDEKIVRDGLSGNTNTPLKLFSVLADDPDENVRYRLTQNSSCPHMVLQKLALDDNEKVKHAAQHVLKGEC